MRKGKYTEEDILKKNLYREYFFDLKNAGISLAPIYKKYGVKQSNFSSFLNGLDRAITFETLESIKLDCDEILQKIGNAKEKFEVNS